MALPSSTANWHWRSKDVSSWAKSWFESQLTDSVIFTQGETTAKVDSLKTFEGDAEVGMRKSKLLTIYDLRLECSWSGTSSDGSVVEGTLTIPEVSHEVGADGDGKYEFQTTTTIGSASATQEMYKLLKEKLPDFLKSKFDQFPEAMLDAHGKDLKVEGTPAASGAATPTAGSGSPSVSAADAAAKLKAASESKRAKATNTSVVKVEATFAASSGDLFDLLTEEQRISMWSRASAKSRPVPDSEYSIFGGNIYGKFLALEKPSKIVQSWILKSPNWPDDHAATLTTTLDQGSDSTKVIFELSGVPTGQEDEIRNNINGYYVRGFQSIGYVQLFHEPSSSSPSLVSESVPVATDLSNRSSFKFWFIILSLVGSLLAAAIGGQFLK